MSPSQLATGFLFQMALILAACRVVGWLARRVGQPQVVGEMIAGVLLGPSLLGLLWPAGQRALFPPESLPVLYVGSQLGVGLYMFVVGLEFELRLLRGRLRSALAVSLSGVLAPFLLGGLLATWLLGMPGLFAERTRPFEAMLFLGAAIAITAFPMLARIIHERGLSRTVVGTLALAAGAIDDALAWCLLAIVLATFGGEASAPWIAILGGGAYVVVVLTVVRRLFAALGRRVERRGRLSERALALTLTAFALGTWAMDAVGLHAVFGGFLLGIAMPRGLFTRELRRQLEPFVVVFLLPMFFTFSGLNTRLDLVATPTLLWVSFVVLLASVAGKGLACWAAARLAGEAPRTALAVAALMNARGLMELILLNIGLEKGFIGPELFSVLVVMAVVTTFLASPLFLLSQRIGAPQGLAPGHPAEQPVRAPTGSGPGGP